MGTVEMQGGTWCSSGEDRERGLRVPEPTLSAE